MIFIQGLKPMTYNKLLLLIKKLKTLQKGTLSFYRVNLTMGREDFPLRKIHPRVPHVVLTP